MADSGSLPDALLSQLSRDERAELAALAQEDRRALDDRLRALGLTKVGHRAAAALALKEPTPQALRVAVVAHSGYFAGGSYGGATRASLSLLRELRRCCTPGGTLDILALTPKPLPEGLAFKLGPGRLGSFAWEDERVWIGREDDLRRLLGGRRYHAVISVSIEASLVHFAASLDAARHWAMAHNYYLPPFGPFRRFAAEPEHVELLRRLDALLSPCEHHAAYLRRYGPPGLTAQPLFAADYHYFHRRDGRGGLQLPEAMRPWEASHRYVTAVSPCPEKGLAVLLALARRLPHVAFAAVTTQWSNAPSVDALRSLPNMTVLAPHDDVDVLFRQTRVLLAPSLWQECCPLVVMESLLRGIPCVSSDVCGLPEANRNPRLVVPTALSYDFARGELRHGVTNAQLEREIGATPPPLPSAQQRAAAAAAAVREEATADEVAPFEAALLRLLDEADGHATLRAESVACRDALVGFARAREGGLAAMLAPLAEAEPLPALEGGGALEATAATGGGAVVGLEQADLKRGARVSDAVLAQSGVRELPAAVAYRVVRSPFVFIRAAPSTEAEVVGMAPVGTCVVADAERSGWVRTAPQPGLQGGWALIDGAPLGLGMLLKPT